MFEENEEYYKMIKLLIKCKSDSSENKLYFEGVGGAESLKMKIDQIILVNCFWLGKKEILRKLKLKRILKGY
jgi:hypothetical protein